MPNFDCKTIYIYSPVGNIWRWQDNIKKDNEVGFEALYGNVYKDSDHLECCTVSSGKVTKVSKYLITFGSKYFPIGMQ